jgi:type VI secretion system protein ImpH
MDTTHRPTNVAIEHLAQHYQHYHFYQAMRALQHYGKTTPARITNNTGFGFACRSITDVEKDADNRIALKINHLGLIGNMGVLPDHISETIANLAQQNNQSLADFIQSLTQRYYQLSYQAWRKSRLPVQYERARLTNSPNHYLTILRSFCGIDLQKTKKICSLPDEAIVKYTGLLANFRRSAVGLQNILTDYFQIPCKVVALQGRWNHFCNYLPSG